MESAVVCGAKHFVGFEICKELLNRGCNVLIMDNEQYLERKHEEKWLEIGRNANLMQVTIEEIRDEINTEAVCFIPFIDFLCHLSPDKIDDFVYTVDNLLQIEKITEYNIIYPSKYQYSLSDTNRIKLEKVFRKNKRNIKLVEFYVPTLYGPWQPNIYLFQQLIEGKPSSDYLDDRHDAIFVEDAVKQIIAGTKQSENEQRILLKNIHSDIWKKCIQYLDDTFSIPETNSDLLNSDIQIKTVKEKHSYQEGLTLQLECFKRFQE